MSREKYIYYDLYEDERPYRWIGIVVWSLILFYLFSVVGFGVYTTPVENGRPVLADSEMRRTAKYIDTVWSMIEESQRIHEEASQVFFFYMNSRAIDSEEAADSIMRLRIRTLRAIEVLRNLSIPQRFSGIVLGSGNESISNPRAFHPRFEEVLKVQEMFVTEIYHYLSDFDESRLDVIEDLHSSYNKLSNDAFGLFVALVG